MNTVDTPAIKRARSAWKLDESHQVLHEGQNQSGADFEQARTLARVLMPQLVGLDGIVRFRTRKEIADLLLEHQIYQVHSKPYNPPGEMVFYQKGRLVIRLKTRGNPQGYRANLPHLSVMIVNRIQEDPERTLGFDNELVKVNQKGLARAKTTAEKTKSGEVTRLRPVDENGRFDGDVSTWAGETHFGFPSDVTLLL